MIRILPLCFILAALAVFSGLGPSQIPPPKTETGKGGDPPAKKIPFDKMKFPPGSIFYLVEEFKEKGIFMTWDEAQKWASKLATMENQLKGEKEPPHSCKLKGTVKGDFVELEAEYEFETTKDNIRVVLGLLGGQLTKEGNLDGNLPHLEIVEDGFVVVVEKKGRHSLRLELKVPVGLRRSGTAGGGSERNFELSLPGAAINKLTLELPPAVKVLHLNDKAEKKRQPGFWDLYPKATDKKIAVAWKDPVTLPGAGPLLTADGQIIVTLEENQVLIDAALTMKDLRGVAKEFQLFLPAQVAQGKVEVDPSIGEVIPPQGGNLPYKLKLKEETSEPVNISVQYRLPRQAKIPVGPFMVENAYRQEGTIVLKAMGEALRGVRLEYLRHGETNQVEPPKTAMPVKKPGAPITVAAFQYWSVPIPGKTKGPKGIPLEIEVKKEKAQVVAELDHHLWLREGNQVVATTRIKIKALTGPLDYVKVQLPHLVNEAVPVLVGTSAPFFPGFLSWPAYPWFSQHLGTVDNPTDYSCEAPGGEGNPELQPADQLRQARIKIQPSKIKEIILRGTYQLPAKGEKARLELPRLVSSPDFTLVDRGARVTVEVADNMEILLDREEPAPDRRKHATDWPLAPATVDFAWRPYRPPFAVTGTVDVSIKDDHAHVQQQLEFPEAAKANQGKPVPCKVPTSIHGLKVGVKSNDGKEIKWLETEIKDSRVILPKDSLVYLSYHFPLPGRVKPNQAGTRDFAVPMVWPENATRIDAKVRLWCEPGTVLTLSDPKQAVWFNQGMEVVPNKDSLPSLVLQGWGVHLPLSIHLQEPIAAKQIDAVIERGFIQAQVDDEGQLYRARFLVRKFHTKHVELEFPLPVSSINPAVYLDGKKIPQEWNGTILRLAVEPNLKPMFLDVEYRVLAELLEQEPFWQTDLHPPVFRGQVFMPRVGWQVNLPVQWTSLVAGDNTLLDFHWAFHNGMLKPEPSGVNEFENWPGKLWDNPSPTSLVFWRPQQGPVRVAHVPSQMWLFLCSGLLLFFGLVINFMSFSRFVLWLFVGVVIMGVLAARFLWPSLIPVVLYGCQPGVLVLIVILGVQWLLRERYRRQLVFLPGFTRVKAGSSLILGSANRSTVPSTVDAPPPSNVNSPGSSVNKIV